MININDYETREDLEKAMYQMHREQVFQLMHSKYGMMKSDIEQLSSLIQYPFAANESATLDKSLIYSTANRIEELAKHLILTSSIVKGACRLISDESKEKEDANGSTTSINGSS